MNMQAQFHDPQSEAKHVHRYELGAKYLFVYERSTTNPKHPQWSRLHRPWCDTLEILEFVVLECTEQHPVAWDQDPAEEKKHWGYVFKLLQTNTVVPVGMVFHNQYPRAAYGQISDSANWRVSPNFTDADVEKYGTDFGSPFGGTFEYAGEVLGRVYRGIRDLSASQDMKVEADALTTYKAWLVQLFNDIGFKVEECEILRGIPHVDVVAQ